MIGTNIKYFRKKQGLTQTELGLMIGVGKSNISMYESGDRLPPLDVVSRLAQVFHIDIDTLVGQTNQTSEAAQKMMELFNQLPPDAQEKAIPLIEAALRAVGLLQ